jgi:glyoxylase-like metal-dependent hydrolase (beta-lactamase superfamily II)
VTSWREFLQRLDEPGPISFEKHVAADWVIPRKGLINLHHEEAKAHGLENGPEAIQVYFYILTHPEHGSFMVDSGVARSVKERKNMPVRFPVTMALPLGDLEVHLDTKTYLESRNTPLSGVFLTHLHLDHILGLTDVPRDVPLYVGPGEADDERFTHLFMRPTTNLNLKGFSALRQWQVIEEKHTPFPYVDIFRDGSVLGLHIPGHTQGSMAFVARTTQGPVLLVGDGSHTVWGWEHGVEPGTFNTDMEEAATSLDRLKAFALAHPHLDVHLGHQSIDHEQPGAVAAR